MRDHDLDSPKGRKAVRAAKRGRGASAEQDMPIVDIDGPFLRRADGSTCVFMTYPGMNLSLMNERERQLHAFGQSQAISAVTADAASIFVLPLRTDTESNLALADRSIEAFRKGALRGSTTAAAEADRRCLEILERHIRPEMARAAAAGANVEWKAYLGMRFSRRSDEEIMGAARDVAAIIHEKSKKEPRILSGAYEILDFIDLYTKGWTPIDRHIGEKVVFPEISM